MEWAQAEVRGLLVEGKDDMPLYEYRCPSCGNKFEEKKPINKRRDAKCPNCGHKAYLVPSTYSLRIK